MNLRRLAQRQLVRLRFLLLLTPIIVLTLLIVWWSSSFLREDLAYVLESESWLADLGLFLFININITALFVLAYLVFRNLVRLSRDRKKQVLGAKLRSRLVLSFVALSLIPTLLLFFVAKELLESLQDAWFAPPINRVVESSMNLAREQYKSWENQLLDSLDEVKCQVPQVSNEAFPESVIPESVIPYDVHPAEISSDNSRLNSSGIFTHETCRSAATSWDERERLTAVLQTSQLRHGLSRITLLDLCSHEQIASSKGMLSDSTLVHMYNDAAEKVLPPTSGLQSVQAPEGVTGNTTVLRKSNIPNAKIVPIENSNRAVLRVSALVDFKSCPSFGDGATQSDTILPDTRFSNTLIVAEKEISRNILTALASVMESNEDYAEIRSYNHPLASSYFLTLAVATLFLVLAAMWVGFYLARGLSVPIQLLAQATLEVSQGNLNYRVPDTRDDELSVLVQSFNMMTADLRKTTNELRARRHYMETVLQNIEVGVISIDPALRVETFNDYAATILDRDIPRRNVHLGNVIPLELYRTVTEVTKELGSSQKDKLSLSQTLQIGGAVKHLQMSISKLGITRSQMASRATPAEPSNSGYLLGYVILIDDLTDLVKAERSAAWRDVAKRIAHEIKNPLTPIQLSAQRIEKRLRGLPSKDTATQNTKISHLSSEEREVALQGAKIILEQVYTLRKLVDEFSHFARMPRANLQLNDLHEIVNQTLIVYRSMHRDVSFEANLYHPLPVFSLDRQLIGQLLVNLFDNAVASLKGVAVKKTITVSTTFDPQLEIITLSVADSGLGIPTKDKEKIFEPYFSTKAEGTGLGLAIVSTIAQDHNAHIRVKDNFPQGAIFSVEFPLKRHIL